MRRRSSGPLVPGWYPDPAREVDTWRWWTGVGWTDQLTDDVAAAPPAADQPMRWMPVAPTGSRRGLVVLIGSAVLVVAFLVAATAVGSIRETGPLDLPRAPIPTSPAPTAASPWTQTAGGTIALGDVATASLPGSPYRRVESNGAFYGLLQRGTMVFASTVGTGTKEWGASVTSGWVSNDLAADTPSLVADNVLRALPELLFASSTKTEVTDLAVEPLVGFDRGEAIRVTATISYAVSGIAATHDDLVLIIVATDPVNYTLWMSSVPNDAPAGVTTVTATAEKTVRRR